MTERRAALCLLLLGFATSEGADEVGGSSFHPMNPSTESAQILVSALFRIHGEVLMTIAGQRGSGGSGLVGGQDCIETMVVSKVNVNVVPAV